MNRFLKLIALALVLCLSISMFAGCGTDEKVKENDGQASDGSVDPGFEAMVPSLTINGESVDISSNPVMLTIDGIDIPFDEFRYTYMYFMTYYNLTDEAFESEPDLYGYFLEAVVEDLKETNFGEIISGKYDIKLTDEDKETVKTYLASQAEAFESKEEYEEALVNAGITEELLEKLITKNVMNERVYLDLFGGDDPRLLETDEQILAGLNDKYVRVHHLLISFDHFEDDETLSDDEIIEKGYELVQKSLDDIKSGKADIYELAQTIGDDPGMYDNEEGYFFTYNEMVEEFVTASFALGVGEISDIVETAYGWHIILRLEQDDYIAEHFEDLKGEYINNAFNVFVDGILNDVEIVYSDYYNALTFDSVT